MTHNKRHISMHTGWMVVNFYAGHNPRGGQFKVTDVHCMRCQVDQLLL